MRIACERRARRPQARGLAGHLRAAARHGAGARARDARSRPATRRSMPSRRPICRSASRRCAASWTASSPGWTAAMACPRSPPSAPAAPPVPTDAAGLDEVALHELRRGTFETGLAGTDRAAHDCGTVLVVDDDEAVRDVLVGMLSEVGYEVRGVGSAREARYALENEEIALLLSDVSMPGETGLDLIRFALCEHPADRDAVDQRPGGPGDRAGRDGLRRLRLPQQARPSLRRPDRRDDGAAPARRRGARASGAPEPRGQPSAAHERAHRDPRAARGRCRTRAACCRARRSTAGRSRPNTAIPASAATSSASGTTAR